MVSFTVKNTGSSPFYYNWPVEISLLDPGRKEPVWRGIMQDADIRKWLPGDDWNSEAGDYASPAKIYTVSGEFLTTPDLVKGEYILALAVLDPAGDMPSVRFAIHNYYRGGRHPMGKIGVGVDINNPILCDFDDMGNDWSLQYKLV